MKSAVTFERILPFSAEMIWPAIADTAGMNRKLGLAPMSFTTKEGVRYGKQKMLGTELSWTELPWEWRQNAWLTNERVYDNGLFKIMGGRFAVEAMGVSQSRVELSFMPTYRQPIISFIFNLILKRLLRQLMDVIEAAVVQLHKSHQIVRPEIDLATWLSNAHEMERAKIAPKEVASLTSRSWQQIFREALTTKNLAMRFEAVCPHCRGGKMNSPRLTDLPEKVFCDSCEIEFSINTQDSIEVSFRDNSISPNMIGMDFCSADVSHKPAIALQRRGPEWREVLQLAPGVYSLKKKGESRSLAFQVEELLPSEDLVIDDLSKPAQLAGIRKIGPRVTMLARQLPNDSLVMLEQLSKVRGALFATEILAVPDLVDLMPAEALVTTFPIEMGERSVLFTDVVGSTDMYFNIGDTAAFHKVRKSFLLIGDIARKYNGTLVKTIGDATMYSFMSASDALSTAMAIQVANRTQDTKLRVTLHHGPCLSIGTRDGQDFFGDTINVCAKFQAVAGADQVAFDRAMQAQVSASLWQELMKGHQVEEVVYEMKGAVKRSFDLFRVTL